MVQKKKNFVVRPLTEVELELMQVIWELEECTVKDVQLRLQEKRPLAYTSVATIMKILEQKQVLASTKSERAHSYLPTISRADYEALSLKHLAENLFDGDPSSMVMRLLNDTKMTQEELQTIRKILDERISK